MYSVRADRRISNIPEMCRALCISKYFFLFKITLTTELEKIVWTIAKSNSVEMT